MLELILASLKATAIDNYIAREEITEGAELYFVRRNLDMRRMKTLREYRVTVYHDFETDGVKMRGESAVRLFPGMTALEIQAALIGAYNAAGYVRNNYFELYSPGPDAVQAPDDTGTLPTPEQAVLAAAEALYAADKRTDAFINSAEIYAAVNRVRIVTSAGVDTAYSKMRINGEYVAQCKTPQDVEQHNTFDLNPDNIATLTAAAEAALKTVCDRAGATEPPEAGTYDVVISGRELKTILNYYTARSNAAMVFPGYSDWEAGTAVQAGGEAEAAVPETAVSEVPEAGGEQLNLYVVPEAPCSPEGIPMAEQLLIEGGRLRFVHGDTRFMRGLGKTPTGSYRNIKLDNGTVPFEELRRGALYPVSFSDFQCNNFTGFFGGEIRLAYLYTEDGVRILTGGSVNGNIHDVQREFVFSMERYADAIYEGPFAVRLKNVRVAGA